MRYGDIKIYDKDLTLLSIIPRYISVNWKLSFKSYGTAEIHLPKNEKIVELFTQNKYLFVTQGDMQAVVTGIKIDKDLTIFAKTLEWLLTKFWVCDFCARGLFRETNDESVCAPKLASLVVKYVLGETVDLKIDYFEDDKTNLIDYEAEGAKNVYTIVRECLSEQNYGFSFRFDATEKCFIFKALLGKENQNIQLCDEYKTSYDSSFTYDIQNCASGGVYYHKLTDCGEWDVDRNIPELRVSSLNYGKYYKATSSGNRMGFNVFKGDIVLCDNKEGRFRVVSEAKPFPVVFAPEENGIFSWSESLSKTDEESAREELSTFKPEESLVCKTKKLEYGKDFVLGDILKTVFTAGDFKAVSKKIITAIHLWDETEDFGAMPTMETYEQKEEEEE